MTSSIKTVSITALAAGGAGVARLEDGMVVFARDTYPGDVAQVRLDKVKKRHAEASLVRLETPSPSRREPECPHVRDCGGCEWMGLDYAAQLEWKRTIAAQTLERIGKIAPPPVTITPSPATLGYRHRVRLKGISSPGGFTFAFRRRGSAQLAPVKSCAVAHARINTVMRNLAAYLAQNPKLAAIMGETLIETDGSKCRVIFHPSGAIGKNALAEMTSGVEGLNGVAAMKEGKITAETGDVWLNAGPAGGPMLLLGPGAFAQANLLLNPLLARMVVEATGLAPGGHGLDLFCGAGNYSIPLAAAGVAITGVDFSPLSVDSADRSRRANSLINAQFTEEDCQEAVDSLIEGGSVFGAVILNPPRAGAGDLFKKALALAQQRAVYVACDPAPLARDAALAAEMGFGVSRVEVFDMFPHTPHMETVAVFQRL